MRLKAIPNDAVKAVTAHPAIIAAVAVAGLGGYLYFKAPTAEQDASDSSDVASGLGYSAPISTGFSSGAGSGGASVIGSSGGGGGGSIGAPSNAGAAGGTASVDTASNTPLQPVFVYLNGDPNLGVPITLPTPTNTGPDSTVTPIQNSTGGISYVPTIGDVTSREVLDFERLQEQHSFTLALESLGLTADINAANASMHVLDLYSMQYQIDAGLAQTAMLSGNLLSVGQVGDVSYSFLNIDSDTLKKNKSTDNLLSVLNSPAVSTIANNAITGNFAGAGGGFTEALAAAVKSIQNMATAYTPAAILSPPANVNTPAPAPQIVIPQANNYQNTGVVNVPTVQSVPTSNSQPSNVVPFNPASTGIASTYNTVTITQPSVRSDAPVSGPGGSSAIARPSYN